MSLGLFFHPRRYQEGFDLKAGLIGDLHDLDPFGQQDRPLITQSRVAVQAAKVLDVPVLAAAHQRIPAGNFFGLICRHDC